MRLPTWTEIRDGLRRYLNPLYHLRKLREDLISMWTALRLYRRSGKLTTEELATSFRGKLLACFFLGGPTIWIGFATAYWLQRKYQNPFIGQYATHAINLVITTLAFQFIWWVGNREMYRSENPTLAGRFRAFQRDLLPVHGNGIRIGMTFNLISWPIVSLILWGIQTLNHRAAVDIPAQAVQQAFDATFINTTFMRLMGDFFERWSVVLAERHGE